MGRLTIDLPDKLAEEAKQTGLLASDALEAMFREHLRRRDIDGLFEAADKLAAFSFPSMTMAEIQVEVDAIRSPRLRHAPGA